MMALEIAAIETAYAGHRFRSRLEARWARFFDAVGITWEYEPEHACRYLPDFVLRGLAGGEGVAYFEVKPDIPGNRIWDDRWQRFAMFKGYPLYVAHGMPRCDGDILAGDSNGQGYIEAYAADGSTCSMMAFATCSTCGRTGLSFRGRRDSVCESHEVEFGGREVHFLRAYEVALGWRFEPGADNCF